MNIGKRLAALAAAFGLLSLAACGGGGGGGPKTMVQAQEDNDPAAARDRVRAADPAKTSTAAGRATIALPRFGSVTQSTNVGSNGVSTDRARAVFTGAGATVKVTRADESAFTIDTADAVDEIDTFAVSGIPNDDFAPPTSGILETCPQIDPECSDSSPDFWSDPLGSRYRREDRRDRGEPADPWTGRVWGTTSVSDRAYTGAILTAYQAYTRSLDSEENAIPKPAPDGWLASGSYLHIAGQNLLSSAPVVESVEMGAFADGPELRSPPTSLPDTGAASYEGRARGMLFGGTDRSSEIGEFVATATLTANFADNTIRGCVGCKGEFTINSVITNRATEATTYRRDDPTDTQLRLGEAQVDADGTWRVRDMTLYSAKRQAEGYRFTEQDGSWGGRFSNVPVATGEPRLAAGTFGGRAARTGPDNPADDPFRIRYLGSFVAGKQ